MTLASTVLLTDRIERLASFYGELLQKRPTWQREDYAAFETPGSTLALFTVGGHDEHIRPGAAVAGENRSMKIELEVQDIEGTYRRLQGNDEPYDWVRSPPAEMPWGTEIVVLQGPDGHLIEIYAPLGET